MTLNSNSNKSHSVYTPKDILLIIFGSFLVAAGVQIFYVHVNILGGGVTALSIMLHILFDVNVAQATFVLNIPILALGYFMVNRQFMLYSTLAMVATTGFMRVLEQVPTPSNALFTCVICGGLLVGAGCGILLRANGSGAGTDVICRIINKYTSFQIGTLSLTINFVLIMSAALVLGLDIAIATISTLFITSQVVNYIVDGLNYKRMVIIISNKGEDIALALSEEFGRGVTTSQVTGAYLGEQKSQVMCTINIHETPRLKQVVLQLDPRAFISMFEVTEAIGSSFKKIKSKS